MGELLRLEELEDQIYEMYAELSYLRDQFTVISAEIDSVLKELRRRKQELL